MGNLSVGIIWCRLSAFACLDLLNTVKDMKKKEKQIFLFQIISHVCTCIIMYNHFTCVHMWQPSFKFSEDRYQNKAPWIALQIWWSMSPGLNRPLSNMKSCKMSQHLSKWTTSKTFWYNYIGLKFRMTNFKLFDRNLNKFMECFPGRKARQYAQ